MALLGIVLATIIGVIVGVSRLSSNWLVRRVAALYVETFRNIPVLVIILFWYLGVMIRLPPIREGVELLDLLAISNRGIVVPWFDKVGAGVDLRAPRSRRPRGGRRSSGSGARGASTAPGEPHRRVLWSGGVLLLLLAIGLRPSAGGRGRSTRPRRASSPRRGGFRLAPEYAALLIALALYTASHIAEIVRGSILAVARGQGEAADAVGLSGFQRLRFVVLPQAFRISVPPISNQYLNLTKNSSLGVAISYYEVTKVTQVSIAQSAPAVQAILVLMGIYLVLSLFIAAVTNLFNRRLTLKGRR